MEPEICEIDCCISRLVLTKAFPRGKMSALKRNIDLGPADPLC